jgi:hypothetical protein
VTLESSTHPSSKEPDTPDLSPGQIVEGFLLVVLEQHDGLCLDNEAERTQLAAAIATALIAGTSADGISLSRLDEVTASGGVN